MRRYASIILALTLIMASVPVTFAAGVELGETASVSFTFKGIYGVDGTFSYSDDSVFSDISYSDSGNMEGNVNNDIAYFYNHKATDFTITVNATVVDSAKDGDTCQITFTYRTADESGNVTGWQTMTKTVTIEAFGSGGEWYSNTLPLPYRNLTLYRGYRLRKPTVSRLPMPFPTMATWHWKAESITRRTMLSICATVTP